MTDEEEAVNERKQAEAAGQGRLCVSVPGVVSLLLLPTLVWVCASYWWFAPEAGELGDLADFCFIMPVLLTGVAALFSFLLLPPWRASRRGFLAVLRRVAAFAVIIMGASAAESMTCCCTTGYDGWIEPMGLVGIIGMLVCIIKPLCSRSSRG